MATRTLSQNDLADPHPHRGAEADREQPGHADASPWWTWTKRGLSLLFFVGVAYLLVRYARTIDWDDVLASVRNTPTPTLLAAAALAATSHLLYSCFDLFGRRYTGHSLSVRTVMSVNFVSYAFNLCIGAIVGGVGFRYRLYSRLGLRKGVITRIVTLSMMTNWIGYMLLAGLLFAFHPLVLPPSWKMGNHGLQWIGGALVLAAVGYLVACVRWHDQVWTVRGHELFLPPPRMAALQLLISCVNWSVMGGLVYMLLQGRVPYTDVLTVLLIGAIAGVIAHVPAGLGVFEFVFIALLSHQATEGQLLAALLVYRSLYYLVPLMVASLLYLAMELRARKPRNADPQTEDGALPRSATQPAKAR